MSYLLDLATPIEDLELPIRWVYLKDDYPTRGDLMQATDAEILRHNNVGKVTLKEIRKVAPWAPAGTTRRPPYDPDGEGDAPPLLAVECERLERIEKKLAAVTTAIAEVYLLLGSMNNHLRDRQVSDAVKISCPSAPDGGRRP